ncbi:hypothetical protein ACFL5H_00145 [Candidatus Latescibacterota bacterium]
MNFIRLISALLVLAVPAGAQDYSLDMNYASKYVWRGSVLAQNGVFQPSFTASMGDLSVNLWGNMDLTNENGVTRKINEWDYTVDYSTTVSGIGISTGIIGYTFPNSSGPGTTELYLGAGLDLPGSPSLTVYEDIEAVNGTYVSLSVIYSVPIMYMTSVDINAAVGLGSGKMNQALYAPSSGAGLADFLVNFSIPIPISDLFCVTPGVIVTSILNSEGQNAYDAIDLDSKNLVFLLTTSLTF